MSLLSGRLLAACRVLELVRLPYRSPLAAVYDFAPWRRLLIRDNELSVGIVVNVTFLGLALRDHGKTSQKGNQSRVDAFHGPPSLAIAHRAKGVPGHNLPRIWFDAPGSALSSHAKWPGLGGRNRKGRIDPVG